MNQTSTNWEAENRHLRKQLTATQNAFQDFVYAVSHDLGVPLRAVTSFSVILQQKYATQLDDKSRTYLNFVAEGGAKAQKMLAGLLIYSRLHTQAALPVAVDMNIVLNSVRHELRGKLDNTHATLHYEDLPLVAADENQMRQLFQALLDNALTYRRLDARPNINIAVTEEAERWKFTITDNGPGITLENCERVFQVFKRLQQDENYPGIGMGLPIARRIVERHGGLIELIPNVSGGMICKFTLAKMNSDILTVSGHKETTYE